MRHQSFDMGQSEECPTTDLAIHCQQKEPSNLPITDDGHLLAYKSVTENFKDRHTGTIDNSPGRVVEMPREEVDSERDRTCSSGLHFCALHYLSTAYGYGGQVVILKINPRDVVSIPSDYNNSKQSVCRENTLGSRSYCM